MTVSATAPDLLVPRLQSIDRHIAAGQLPRAVEELNAAIRAYPGDPRIYLLGARLATAANNPKGAQDAARKALSLAPNWPVAITELAFLLARHNELREAITLAERAVQLDGNNPEVLMRVIDIAHRAQHMPLAIAWLQRARAVLPRDVRIQRLLARDLRQQRHHDQSLSLYNEILAAAPEDTEARLGRVQTAIAMGDLALAQADCAQLLANAPDHPELHYWAALARGETPQRTPASMVHQLYDSMADLYDQHMVAGLKYKLPREVARMIFERFPDRKLNVIDLGCGTGLLGVCLGRIDGALVGVELSAPMITQALRHNVYDRIHSVDLLDALEATPAGLYDVAAALDVLIYIGDLSRVVPDAFKVIKPGGQFMFSCEAADEDGADYVLRPTQRFAHKRSHVEALCRAAGFGEVVVEPMDLRLEDGVPVPGYLVTARKPA
jgi:predicted TPR repeat methyltransferase